MVIDDGGINCIIFVNPDRANPQLAIHLNSALTISISRSLVAANTPHFGTFFEAAMKAQEQARKTLQTLHDIKNPQPRTVFIKNAIAQQGNQLVTKTDFDSPSTPLPTPYSLLSTPLPNRTAKISAKIDSIKSYNVYI